MKKNGRARPWHVVLWLAVALLCVCVERGEGRTKRVLVVGSSNRKAQLDSPFGFASGGQLRASLQVTPKDKYFYLVLMDAKQWDFDEQAQRNRSDYACQLPSAKRFEFRSTLNIRTTIEREALYRVFLLNCNETQNLVVSGELELKNPNGGLMSLQEEPYVNVFLMVSCLDLLMLLVWQYLYLRYRPLNALANIPNGVRICILFRLFYNVALYVFYEQQARTGVVLEWLLTFAQLISIVAEGTLMALMWLLSHGWCVTVESIDAREQKLTYVAFLVYATCNTMRTMCTGSEATCSTYALAYWIIKFVITLRILLALNGNMEILRASTHSLGWPQTVPEQIKLRLFRQMRVVFMAFVVLPVLLILFELTLSSWQERWVFVLVDQALHFLVYARLCQIYQPHAENVTIFDHLHQA